MRASVREDTPTLPAGDTRGDERGDLTDWHGWLAAILAAVGATELVAGLRDGRVERDLRAAITASIGAIGVGCAIWVTPSWRWVVAGLSVVAVILAFDVARRRLSSSRTPWEATLVRRLARLLWTPVLIVVVLVWIASSAVSVAVARANRRRD
jgi:hypothetical protein